MSTILHSEPSTHMETTQIAFSRLHCAKEPGRPWPSKNSMKLSYLDKVTLTQNLLGCWKPWAPFKDYNNVDYDSFCLFFPCFYGWTGPWHFLLCYFTDVTSYHLLRPHFRGLKLLYLYVEAVSKANPGSGVGHKNPNPWWHVKSHWEMSMKDGMRNGAAPSECRGRENLRNIWEKDAPGPGTTVVHAAGAYWKGVLRVQLSAA